ncbi:MAG: PRC-barrel domain-containing protein [Thermoplasmatota archaeon]
MLAEILEKYHVVNSVGEEFGKVKEAYLNLETWEVSGFEISPGALKKHFLLKLQEIQKIDTDEKFLVVKDDFERAEVPKVPVKGLYPLDRLMSAHVVDSEGKKVGKIYNLEIPYEKMKKLKVWKVMIKTGIKERRLRLSPAEIADVKEEIHLKKIEKDYEG